MDSASYDPLLQDLDALLQDRPPERLLLVGGTVPSTIDTATSVRQVGAATPPLPTGVYRFHSASSSAVLAVMEGTSPADPDSMGHWDDGHPLALAHDWFAHWWTEATDIPPPQYRVRDEVMILPDGQIGLVQRRRFSNGEWVYGVRAGGRSLTLRDRSLLEPPHDDDPLSWIKGQAASARRFAATLTRAKLSLRLSDTVFSFRASRTLFRPYQFRPVMRLLETGSFRLLIADEVGLGKTIEAGLVWTELDARAMANRVLVVVPSMLVPKWKREMDERFGFQLTELKRADLDEMLERFERDAFHTRFHGIVSLEGFRVWKGLERLSEIGPRFDLVIADEAHAFRNTGTRSSALGHLLSDWADALLFLSATPLNLGNEDLYNLVSLLSPGEFESAAVLERRLEPNAVLNRVRASLVDRAVGATQRLSWLAELDRLTFGAAVTGRPEYKDLVELLSAPALSSKDVVTARSLLSKLHALSTVVTRTRKIEIEERKAVRQAIPIEVELTDAEFAFYSRFRQWLVERALARGVPPGFAIQMPLRLAASCLPMARAMVLKQSAPEDGFDLDGPIDDNGDGSGDDDVDDEVPPPEVVELARAVGEVDTKFDRFVPELVKVVKSGRRVLVFTFSRATLAYLERRLAATVRLDVLHGDVKKPERERVMARFRAGEFDVLLASRVASEGLDFEFCSVVVNYDLPWNPMEVEQRIGRVDRFGQEEDKIYVLNFHTPGTIETDIVERLMARIGVFHDSIGELEPILQSRWGDISRTLLDFRLSDDEKIRRLDEMAAAMEEQRQTLDQVETAASFLASTDDAEIDGLERELERSGRYVGQPELVLLLEDWINRVRGAKCTRSQDGTHLVVRGTQELEGQLRAVAAAGERSSSEIDLLARKFRNEADIALCLDQETARRTGAELLTANHPLTRAALHAPGHGHARFSHLRMTASDVAAGFYFVLVAVARWNGLQSSNELWTATVTLPDNTDGPIEIGTTVLAQLASAALDDGRPLATDLTQAFERARAQLDRRLAAEEDRLEADNRTLVATRRLSFQESHARKAQGIRDRITTAQRSGTTSTVHLFEAQLRHQERLLADKLADLDRRASGAMSLELLAGCTVEVVNPS